VPFKSIAIPYGKLNVAKVPMPLASGVTNPVPAKVLTRILSAAPEHVNDQRDAPKLSTSANTAKTYFHQQ
jgi:hypothetical protein